ncbi:MAG: hypothetical protein IPG04_25020 [Polyangiaceae bacterium]|nr:hypothetical protein [Polyangiaceae bacterium]
MDTNVQNIEIHLANLGRLAARLDATLADAPADRRPYVEAALAELATLRADREKALARAEDATASRDNAEEQRRAVITEKLALESQLAAELDAGATDAKKLLKLRDGLYVCGCQIEALDRQAKRGSNTAVGASASSALRRFMDRVSGAQHGAKALHDHLRAHGWNDGKSSAEKSAVGLSMADVGLALMHEPAELERCAVEDKAATSDRSRISRTVVGVDKLRELYDYRFRLAASKAAPKAA